MRLGSNSILVFLLTCFLSCYTFAADPSTALPADSLVINAAKAQLWNQDDTSVAELIGPVHIELDHAKMSADNGVVWISPNPDGPTDSHRVQIALIGRAKLQQQGVLRMDQRLLVKAIITGDIQLLGDRVMGADESSSLYLSAASLRAGKMSATTRSTTAPTTAAIESSKNPTTSLLSPLDDLRITQPGELHSISSPTPLGIKNPPRVGRTIEFDGDYTRAVTSDGLLAAVCSNGVNLRYRNEAGDLMEFTAHDMVLFTNLTQLKGAGEGGDKKHFIQDHIVSAYFEGDVQVYVTPASTTRNELRMRAEHVYYELATDRAVMTDVLFHTVDLKKAVPVFMRAAKIRQLSVGEMKVEGMELTNSAFATPTYSLSASNAYVRSVETGDPNQGSRITFEADNAVVLAVGVPIFYFPAIGGTMSTKGSAFRTVALVNDNQYGFGVRTRWGLLETLGQVPPKDLDASYTLDYLSKRGPAGGIDATYSGGFVSDTTREPWNFMGDLHSYFIDDHGVDQLGAARVDEKPDDQFRGRLYFEHQHFFPDDWQAQLRLGYVSDSNFMAQYFNDEFQNGLPIDESIYLKHSTDSEMFSFLAEGQPNKAISTADEEQQNREISRLPEITYSRIGDSLLADHLTFFSENSGSALKFVRNDQSLTQQGFYTGAATGPLSFPGAFPGIPPHAFLGAQPGIPSYAYTGDPGSTTYRGDLRQEIDYPINAGPVKLVPYGFIRYTGYTQGVVPPVRTPQQKNIPATIVTTSGQNRLMLGAGARVTTDFWKVDDNVESDIFDLHRLRHIIEPELNVFTSTSNVDQNKVFIYDPQVDGANDVSAVQLALHQRWQTKRGGPGKWRSVDFFALNLYGNFFTNQPENRFRDPTNFRGIFYYNNPEASVARNSANADATWRVSDTTAVLADVEENLDKLRLATASVGVAVQRDARLNYFIGTRYIADLHSNIITFDVNYQLDRKYSIAATESLDLAQSKDVYYTFSLTRSFDNFQLAARVFYDQSTNDKGFSLNIQPLGVRGVGSDRVQHPTN